MSSSPDGDRGFRWTEQSGMVALAGLPDDDGRYAVSVWDVSPNGKYICGQDLSADLFFEAVLWTPEGEAIGLGGLPGGDPIRTTAYGVSNDGRVVVGEGQNLNDPSRAFVWTPETGMMYAEDAILAEGIDVLADGWRLRTVDGVSADGHWITGYGSNPDGNGEAWIAYLPNIPTPPTLVPLAAAGLLIARRRR